MMRVTIDASCLVINRHSGLSQVVHNLLLYLPYVDNHAEFNLFINCFRNPEMKDYTSYPKTTSDYCTIPRRLVAWWWKLGWPPIDPHLIQTDLFHSFHVQVPPTKKMKTVLTIHDCRFLALSDFYTQREVENYRHQMMISLKRADMVATVSEFTRQEFLTYFSFPEDHIKVIQNGFDSPGVEENYPKEEVEFLIESKKLPQSFLLYIGVLDPRKNLQRLVEAIAYCRNETEDFPDLVIAGITQEQWLRSDQAIRAKELGVFDHIYLVGVVERYVLSGLTEKALALCYPSLYEGFGFPPLEAMSLGVPVLAGDCSAIPEVTGHAACLVDPTSVDDIAQGLNKIVFDSDYRQTLIKRGYDQIQNFSWHKSAIEYLKLYKEVVNL
jgi:glycosyltransferase involved in cell wall biosynthesis